MQWAIREPVGASRHSCCRPNVRAEEDAAAGCGGVGRVCRYLAGQREGGPLPIGSRPLLLPSPGGGTGWSLLARSSPPAPASVGWDSCPGLTLALLQPGCAGASASRSFLSCWIWSRCIVHLIKLYLISFVFRPFVSAQRLWGGGEKR